MKIVVLTGSPRKNGNSTYLAGQFVNGAEEAGHNVLSFDCAKHKVGGCLACNHCGMDGPCVQKDDFEIVRPHIEDADMIVFASPVYYFGISAQLKSVVDRFYAIHNKLQNKKSAILLAFANPSDDVAEASLSFYKSVSDYLNWEDKGAVLASGVWSANDVRITPFGTQAYELGKNL